MKVAVPTFDGIRLEPRFGRAPSYAIAEVGLGSFDILEHRRNPVTARQRGRRVPSPQRVQPEDRFEVVASLLADCRVVIAQDIDDDMRMALDLKNIEVVVTSEGLLDRALALLSLAALRDESRGFLSDGSGGDEDGDQPGPESGFDG